MPGPLLALLPIIASVGMQLYKDSKGKPPPSAGLAGASSPAQGGAMMPETSGGAALSQHDNQGPVAPATSPLTSGKNYSALPGQSPLQNTGPVGGFQPVGQNSMLPQAESVTGPMPGEGGGAGTGLGYAQAALGAGQTLHDMFAKDGKPPAGAGYGARGGFNPGPSMRLGDLYGQARKRYY